MTWYKTGKLTLTQGSNIVTATGSAFTENVTPKFGLIINDSEIYEIASVDSDTKLTLTSPYSGTSKSGYVNWSIFPTQGIVPELISKLKDMRSSFEPIKANFNDIKTAPASTSASLESAQEAAQVASDKAEATLASQAATALIAEEAETRAGVEASILPTPNKMPIATKSGMISGGWVETGDMDTQILNALYPDGIYPFVDLRFVGATKINDPHVKFSRASKATYWDADGILREAEADEPRFDHDPVTGEALGLLRERASTNLIINSEKFNGTGWMRGSGVSANGDNINFIGTELSPTEASPRVYQSVPLSEDRKGRMFVRTLIIPPKENWSDPTAILRVSGIGGFDPTFRQDITAKDNQQIIVHAGTAISSGITIIPILMNTDKDCSIKGIKVQFEENTLLPTSYIKSGDSATTRADDIITVKNKTGMSLFKNGITGWSFVLDQTTKEVPISTLSTIRISLLNGKRLRIFNDNKLNSSDPSEISDGLGFGIRNKISCSITPGVFTGSFNGNLIKKLDFTNYTTINTNSIRLGENTLTAGYYNGHLRSLQLYNRALSDNKLQELSSL